MPRDIPLSFERDFFSTFNTNNNYLGAFKRGFGDLQSTSFSHYVLLVHFPC